MAAGAADRDARMEELVDQLVDQGLGMEETAAHSLLGRPSLGETYRCDSLLAPDTDFMADDHSSATSGLDVADRLTYLEQRMQMQEDEIQLLKMALADVLKRLNISEEHQAAAASRRAPGIKTLPSRPPTATSNAASLKKFTTLPSTPTARNYSLSPTPTKSAAKSPAGSVKDSPCKTAKTRPTSAAPTLKKAPDSRAKDPAVSLGTRRVTHCKVTMQICLSPLARRTGSSESAASSVPRAKGGARPEARKSTPSFTLNLRKTTTGQNTTLDTSSYKSPLKSPSHYFQICY